MFIIAHRLRYLLSFCLPGFELLKHTRIAFELSNVPISLLCSDFRSDSKKENFLTDNLFCRISQCTIFFELSNDQCARSTGASRLYGNSCSAAFNCDFLCYANNSLFCFRPFPEMTLLERRRRRGAVLSKKKEKRKKELSLGLLSFGVWVRV